jgi:hypothetical protein
VSPSPRLKKEVDLVSETLFCSYLEFRMMDKVHKLSDSEYYTPSSGHAVAYVVGALCYKPEGRGFESRYAR